MDATSTVMQDIVETLEDGRKGFEEGAAKLDELGRSGLAQTFRRFSTQRGEFSAELRRLAGAHGVEIDESGSLAGALHRGWMAVRDAIAGDDPDGVLDAAEQGEDHAVAEYRKALDRQRLDQIPDDIRDVLVRQFDAVKAAHDEIRGLRDRQSS